MLTQIREVLQAILRALSGPRLVGPVIIQGIGTGAAYAAGDQFGTVTRIEVPPKGVIVGALWYDLNNSKLAKDVYLFQGSVRPAADNAAAALSAEDLIRAVGCISFTAPDYKALNANALGSLNGLNVPYEAPAGLLYVSIVTQGADNIAASAIPSLALVIV